MSGGVQALRDKIEVIESTYSPLCPSHTPNEKLLDTIPKGTKFRKQGYHFSELAKGSSADEGYTLHAAVSAFVQAFSSFTLQNAKHRQGDSVQVERKVLEEGGGVCIIGFFADDTHPELDCTWLVGLIGFTQSSNSTHIDGRVYGYTVYPSIFYIDRENTKLA